MFVNVLIIFFHEGTINGRNGCGEVYDVLKYGRYIVCVCIYKNNN